MGPLLLKIYADVFALGPARSTGGRDSRVGVPTAHVVYMCEHADPFSAPPTHGTHVLISAEHGFCSLRYG